MGPLPRGLLLGVCAVFLASVFADAETAKTSSMVIGLAKCADCTRKNMEAQAAFRGLQVAVKCKNSNGEYETKAVGEVEKSGAFSVPLAADLLREDGELKQACFAQLHSASNQPCPGQEPSWVVKPSHSHDAAEKTTFVAAAGDVHYPSEECASAFLCDPFHKKHFLLHHFHKKLHHPPADQKVQSADTDAQLFKKLLPFIKKNPFLRKLPKFPPVKP